MPPVTRNQNGGFFCNGTHFNSVKWAEVIEAYTHLRQENGQCTIRQLASYSKVSYRSARKAIIAYNNNEMPPAGAFGQGFLFNKSSMKTPS